MSLKKLNRYLEVGIWDLNTDSLRPGQRLHVVACRVLMIVKDKFIRCGVGLHASALTNITLMSIVPVLAFMFSLAKGLGAYEKINATIQNGSSDLPESVREILGKILEFIQTKDISALGPLAIIITLWTIISVIGKVELSFNLIWNVEKGRDLMTKAKEYLFVSIFLPIAFVATTSLNAALKFPDVKDWLHAHLGDAGVLIANLISMTISLLLLSGAFAYIFRFLPNTHVRYRPAIGAGLLTASIWMLTQWVYIKFQIGVSGANSIYGAFAALPLFLSWLYISWLITLLGASICYGLQCHRDHELDEPDSAPAPALLRDAGILIYADMIEHFHTGRHWDCEAALNRLRLPNRIFRRALRTLVQKDLATPLAARHLYSLTCPPHEVDGRTLIHAFEGDGLLASALADSPARASLERFQRLHAEHMAKLQEHRLASDAKP